MHPTPKMKWEAFGYLLPIRQTLQKLEKDSRQRFINLIISNTNLFSRGNPFGNAQNRLFIALSKEDFPANPSARGLVKLQRK
jgi:hypothetical protein